jgi:hypothetical protein
MTAILKTHISCLSWCGILLLCLAICFQLLGAPGTLLDFADSEDDFQASVMIGYTIASGAFSPLSYLISDFAVTEASSIHPFIPAFALFHPPLLA